MRAALLWAALAAVGAASATAQPPAYSIEITSPLGRSGLPGKVRIVARVSFPEDAPAPHVRFFVEDKLLGTDTDGPPFAIEWEDVNPYEKIKLLAELDDPDRGAVRAEIALPSFDFVEESTIMSVGLDAAVQDAKGRFIGGLTQADFQLVEDGIAQEIDSLTSDSAPATFALLVDSSWSMSRNIDFVQRAASRFMSYVRDVDAVVIAPFRAGITSVTGPTRDAATISEAIAAIKPAGKTAILDALKDVGGRFGDGPGRRVVVLITDGYDEASLETADAVLDELKDSRVTVYVISVGGVAGVSLKGERMLRRIAADTGGRAFFPWDQRQLAEAHVSITEDIRHQYLLTYTPKNQEQDGSWRTIGLTTADGRYRVRARAGYRAPSPPPVRASIEFTVTDDRLRYVDLNAGELSVLEDGVRQKLDAFNEAVAPVSIMLALDGSGSMARAAEAARLAAHAFVQSLRSDDALGVLVFADDVQVAHDLTTKRDISHEAVDAYQTKGGTALYDGVAEAVTRLRSVPGRRAVVLVSDGRDENAPSTGPGSTRSWEEAMDSVRDAEATIYVIGLGARVDRERLEQMASVTGGEAYFTTDVAELEQHYRRIVEELHRRYVLGYTSTNNTRDGAWRRVEINVPEGLRVRSRGGYFAPGGK
jgi:VWFA-related protein